jgi:hypothetical protein
VIGKFKDETKGVVISEFVGLRPKMYSFVTVDDHEVKKAKGVSKAVVSKELFFSHYKSVLFAETRDSGTIMASRATPMVIKIRGKNRMAEKINELYKNPNIGLVGKKKLLQRLKKDGIDVDEALVDEFYANLDIAQRNRSCYYR